MNPETTPEVLLAAARAAWDRAFEKGSEHGYRNAQVSVLAPTGTIGLVMDCDTTGIEPDFALVKFKKLAGGGYFKIINQAIPAALERLAYSDVEIAEIDAERAAAREDAIQASGGSARASIVDVTADEEVDSWSRQVLQDHGSIDVLVNNVGHYLNAKPFRVSSPEDWDALRKINLHHVFLVTRAFVTGMIDKGAGSIVNVHSVEGMRGYPGDPVYRDFSPIPFCLRSRNYRHRRLEI